MWVLQDTVAVVAISNETKKWEGIDNTAHDYSLPHFVSPNLCRCISKNSPEQPQYGKLLDNAVFDYLKETFLHYVIILYEEESTGKKIRSV